MGKLLDDDVWRDVLNRLVLSPRMKNAARGAGIHPTTLFGKIKESVAQPEKHTLTWLGHDGAFHLHVNAARKLNIAALDHAARDLAINGHTEPRFHDGKPVWRRDPKIEADAMTLDEMEWISKYGVRPRTDTFERDETGALIQETVTHPPNPAILVKLLTSLAPDIYGERSTVEHHHSGSVWVEGAASTPQLPPGVSNLNYDFGLLPPPAAETQRPTNTLAVPRPCADSAEFDKRFRKKLVRDVVLFRDTEGRLLPPLPDDVVIAGTRQARAFEDAGIKVELVRAETLLDEGFENDFLFKLAPGHKLKPAVSKEEAAKMAAAKMAGTSKPNHAAPPPRAAPPGKASARYDAENLGHGQPKPGGRRVVY